MQNRQKSMSHRGYTIYAITGTILEVALLLAVVLWFLPILNIHIPWWGTVLMLLALLGYSYFTYIMGIRALDKKPMLSPEALIGCEGEVATPLNPCGYVKIKGEMWKASAEKELKTGEAVVVRGAEGMKLIVRTKVQVKNEDNQVFPGAR
jgi:membrane-bound serine protease (ClpP class)